MKRLKIIESKNKDQLDAIKDQGERQSEAIRDHGEKQLDSIEKQRKKLMKKIKRNQRSGIMLLKDELSNILLDYIMVINSKGENILKKLANEERKKDQLQ